MAYKNIEQQRKCQREWAAKKAAATKTTVDIKRGTPSWDAVVPVSEYKGLKTLGQCAQAAAKLINRNKTNRFGVAALALRVCEITHGGVRRGARPEANTLQLFSTAIGVNYKTLWDWVDAYRFVQKHLPKDTERVRYTAIRDAIWWSNRTKEDPAQLYQAFATRTDNRRGVFEAIKRMRVGMTFLKKNGLKYFLPVEVQLFEEWNTLVYGLLKENKQCQKDQSTSSKGILKRGTSTTSVMERLVPSLPDQLSGSGRTLRAHVVKS